MSQRFHRGPTREPPALTSPCLPRRWWVGYVFCGWAPRDLHGSLSPHQDKGGDPVLGPTMFSTAVLLATTLAAGSAAAASAATTQTLAAAGEMNDAAGSTKVVDSGPHHLTGTLKGGVKTTGSTLAFTGSGVVTATGSSALALGAQPFTMEARLRFSKVPSATVGDYDILRGTPGGGWRLEIVARKKRTIAVAACGYAGSKAKLLLTGGPHLADGAWHVVRCVKTDTSVSVVVDGVEVAKRAIVIGSVTTKD